MFQPYPWPRAILHLDANAFFASVMQATYPKLKGQPVIVGAERGIAVAVSYEARKFGLERGMLINQAKKICPQVKILNGDYSLFSLYSQKMFHILNNFCPAVEQYSVDEGFMDITGLRRPLHSSYQQIALKIQQRIKTELDLPVSVGISLTKSLAKLASGFVKPMGITLVDGPNIESFLKKIPLIKVWGIGPATSSYLEKYNIKTALSFARLKNNSLSLNKSHLEIQQELMGHSIYKINPYLKNSYQSISKTHTFPASKNINKVWAELLNNIEEAFSKARLYNYFVGKMSIYLKTQTFTYITAEVDLEQKQQYPMLFRKPLKQAFAKIFETNCLYRASGVILSSLSKSGQEQGSLFDSLSNLKTKRVQKLYQALSGKNKIDFGASLYLHSATPAPKFHSGPKPTILPRFNLPMLEI